MPSPRTNTTPETGAPVPPDNAPGHHPDTEQDKPSEVPAAYRTEAGMERFGFRYEPLLVPFAAANGVTPWTAWVAVDDDELHVQFGPWRLRTPRSNIEGVALTGPYRFAKVAGPPRLSFADRGITFATTRERGVCIRFREPVSVLPGNLLTHPGVTVTVDNPDRLAAVLS